MRFPSVDIVVPIFNAREDVIRCLRSVLNHSTGNWRLLLCDDASTDSELVNFLKDTTQKDSRVIWLRAKINGGFVESANMGLRAAGDNDVLLLNSDTIVTARYLENIQECAYSDKKIGVVCPFSNNATICSIPKFCSDNLLPTDLILSEYAELIEKTSLKEYPPLVTGVGFCMYVKSEVVKKVGLFDAVYGRGFGEENDFCEIAKQLGYQIRLCDSAFVAHTGKASFGLEGRQLESKNMKVLLQRFPNYMREVTSFCEINPLASAQARANYHTKRHAASAYPTCLHIIHSNPFLKNAGGSEHYLLDLVKNQALPRAIVSYPSPEGVFATEVLFGDVSESTKHFYPLLAELRVADLIEQIINDFGIGFSHIHHLFNWPIDIWRTLKKLSVPLAYSAHDFYCLCPSHNLFDYSKMSPCLCNKGENTADCLHAYEANSGRPVPDKSVAAVERHRREFGELLTYATTVIAPSNNTLKLISERSDCRFNASVIPHGYDYTLRSNTSLRNVSLPIRVAILGAVNYPNKGAENYIKVLDSCKNLPIEWHIFGDVSYFNYENRLKQTVSGDKLFLHGAYPRQKIVSLLREKQIDLVLLLPACYETFSFTLSESLIAGVPALGLNVGSLPERLQAAGLKNCIANNLEEVNFKLKEFCENLNQLNELREKVRHFTHTSLSECAENIINAYGTWGTSLRTKTTRKHRYNEQAFQAYCRARDLELKALSPVVKLEQWKENFLWRSVSHLGFSIGRRTRNVLQEREFKKLTATTKNFSFADVLTKCAYSADVKPLEPFADVIRFEAQGNDPYFVLPPLNLETSKVNLIRLRMRCSIAKPSRTQFFWVHQEGEAFSEEKSISVPLRDSRDWQEILLDLRKWRFASRWSSQPRIYLMRVDPLDCEGVFELRDLTLGHFLD